MIAVADDWADPGEWTPVGADRLRVALGRRCGDVARAAVHRVRTDHPGLPVDSVIGHGRATDVLLRLAISAETVVIGRRASRPVGEPPTFAVCEVLVDRTPVPLAVVPQLTRQPVRHRVVVGIAASPESQRLLPIAFDAARHGGRHLDVAICWYPTMLRLRDRSPRSEPEARRWAAEALAGWRELYPDVHTRVVVRWARPVEGLLDAADGQDLLVVGRDDKHHPMRTHCTAASRIVRRADTPVLVVPVPSLVHDTVPAATRTRVPLADLLGPAQDPVVP